eukprot:497481-Hanusia_phi.AAC.1
MMPGSLAETECWKDHRITGGSLRHPNSLLAARRRAARTHCGAIASRISAAGTQLDATLNLATIPSDPNWGPGTYEVTVKEGNWYPSETS